MEKYDLVVDYRCPVKLKYLSDFTTSAVNSVATVTGMKWETIIRSLMEISKERAYMPTYITCVTDMLRLNGFVTESCHMPVGSFVKMCENSKTTDRYILKIDYYGYLAAVPSEICEGYVLRGIRPSRYDLHNRSIDTLWKYIPGTDNRTGIRRKGFELPHDTKGHRGLAVVNMNPQDHNVGDCSVRALCAALECSWDEAIDLLASVNRYTDPVINSFSNINNALIKLEFERHKALNRNNRLLTGKEFAELMTYTFIITGNEYLPMSADPTVPLFCRLRSRTAVFGIKLRTHGILRAERSVIIG